MPLSRRSFMTHAALGAGLLTTGTAMAMSQGQDITTIAGFEKDETGIDESQVWRQKFDRKLRVGLVGYGLCEFSAHFSFQTHPNVDVVAVSDLIPERCAALAAHTKCNKTYPSLEEMVKDDSIEAIFVATDAPSHAQHCLEVLKHGKHVACAVPAVFGSDQLEDAEKLFELVKKTGLTYMMFETSAFHAGLYAMREIYKAGGFGSHLIYSEGEYFHYMPTPLPGYKDWRVGLPPQYYPTHGNAYYICVSGDSFTEVSCVGHRTTIPHLMPENNVYRNPFGSEYALFKTSLGGAARMAVAWDVYNPFGGEKGRVCGQNGAYWDENGNFGGLPEAEALVKTLNLKRPPLPPGVEPGYHGGSHGPLCHEFVMSILENRKPYVDIALSLNMTVAGIIAHQSAMKDGELLKIPQYKF